MALDRTPESPTPAASEPFTLPQLPKLPSFLPRIRVQSLTVGSLELGAPILGQAASFTLDGRAGTGADGRSATAELHARRTDGSSARLDLGATLGLPDSALRLDLTGSETGGLVAAVTGRPEAGDLNLALHGDGPLADWHGRLDAGRPATRPGRLGTSPGLRRAQASGARRDGGPRPGLLQPELGDALGTHAELALDVAEIGPGAFALQNLALRAAGIALVGKGSADLASDRLTGEMTLTVPDLAPFSGLAATPLAGNATGKLTADGPLRRPALHLALDGSDLGAAEAALANLSATLDLAVTEPLGEGPIAARIDGHAVAEGLSLAGRPIADGRAALTLAGEIPARGEAVLSELSLHTVLGDIAAHGSIDRRTLAGTVRLDARVPELGSVLSALAIDSPLHGAVAAGTDVALSDRAQRIEMVLDGGASGLSGLPPGAQELVGASPKLSARATVVPGTEVAVQNLAVAGSGFALEGEPRLALTDGALGGELRLKVRDLSPLRPALGQPIAGSAALRAALGGTLDVPKLDVDSSVERLALAGQSIERASLAGSLTGPFATPSGSARLGLTAAGKDAKLGLDYRLAGGHPGTERDRADSTRDQAHRGRPSGAGRTAGDRSARRRGQGPGRARALDRPEARRLRHPRSFPRHAAEPPGRDAQGRGLRLGRKTSAPSASPT